MNKILVAGNLTRDPEVKVVKGNMKVVGFSLAVNDRSKDKTVSFFDCDAFGKTAEFIGANFVKGKQILVEGRLKQDSYTNKDGVKVSKIRIKVDEVHYIQGEKNNAVAAPAQDASNVSQEEPEYSF